MKHTTYILAILLISIIFSFYTCQKPSRDNPWDDLAKLDPKEWAPKNLLIEAPNITQRTLSWEYDSDSRIEGFKIDRKHGNQDWLDSYSIIRTELRNFTDTITPDSSISYIYRIYAFAGPVKSNPIEKSTNSDIPAPSHLVIRKVNDISYLLNWIDNSINESGFIIERKTTELEFAVLDTLPPNSSTFIDTNVFRKTNQINITYRIKAFYGHFHSRIAQIDANAELSAPDNLQITKNSINSVTLTWNDNSTGEEGFLIERLYSNQQNWDTIQKTSSNITTFIDDNSQLNTQVLYRISAFNTDHYSITYQNSIDLTIPPPSGIQIIKNNLTSITINWNDNSIGEEGFCILRKHQDELYWDTIQILNPNSSSWTDNSFQLNNLVSYRVSSFFGDYSSAFIEKNFDSEIIPPSNLSFTQNSLVSITLNWQDNTNGEEGFLLERKYGDQNNWEVFQITSSNITSFIDTSFAQNKIIYYRISSFYQSYFSNFSETSFNSNIPRPYNLGITADSINSISLVWDYSFSGHNGFLLQRRIDDENWENIAENLSPNVRSYNDVSVNLQNHNYAYQISAFIDQDYSQWNTFPFLPDFLCGIDFIYDQRDDNVYESILIGNQCWMKENLKYLPAVYPSTENSWSYPVFYVYGYEGINTQEASSTANYQTYGVLYNHTAALISCPAGWHLPTSTEYISLIEFLGGGSLAGGKMKSTSTLFWEIPNFGATNESGFSGLPGGFRSTNNYFNSMGNEGVWWSSTTPSQTSATFIAINYNSTNSTIYTSSSESGYSVRCLKD